MLPDVSANNLKPLSVKDDREPVCVLDLPRPALAPENTRKRPDLTGNLANNKKNIDFLVSEPKLGDIPTIG